jgi:putative heme-binding domain-containing protein
VLKSAVLDSDPSTVAFVQNELARHRVSLEGLPGEPGSSPPRPAEAEVRVVIAKADPKNPDQIGNMSYESAARRALQSKGNADRGLALFNSQSCRACHTVADGQTPKGPHLVDIGKRYTPAELVESILKPGAKIAQGYEAYTFAMADGRVYSGFIVSEGPALVQIRESSGLLQELKKADIEERRRLDSSAMPEGIAGSLTPEQLADLVAYLQLLDPNREHRPDR